MARTRLEKSLHMNLKSKTKPISAFSTETFLNKVSKSYLFDGQRKETKEMLLIWRLLLPRKEENSPAAVSIVCSQCDSWCIERKESNKEVWQW